MKINFIANIYDNTKLAFEKDRPMRKDLPPGSAQWTKGSNGLIASLLFTCPCGCGNIDGLPVYHGANGWTWCGNEQTPTLTPSILMTCACRWHGYLTKGEFKAV